MRLGVSTESLSETIRVATIGDVGPALAKFDAGDRIIPIRVLLDEKAPAPTGRCSSSCACRRRAAAACRWSRSPTSASAQGPISITRYDRAAAGHASKPTWSAGAALSEAAMAAIKALPVMKSLPPGITVTEAGDAELQAELFEGFGSAMRNGLMMVYVVLAMLFAQPAAADHHPVFAAAVDRGRDHRRCSSRQRRSARRW